MPEHAVLVAARIELEAAIGLGVGIVRVVGAPGGPQPLVDRVPEAGDMCRHGRLPPKESASRLRVGRRNRRGEWHIPDAYLGEGGSGRRGAQITPPEDGAGELMRPQREPA